MTTTAFNREPKNAVGDDDTAIEPAGKESSGPGGFRMDSLAPGMGEITDAGARPKKYSETLVFFAVLLVAAAGVLFGLRKIGVGPLRAGASTTTTKVDLAAAQAGTADHRKVLADLRASQVGAQVPVEQVQRNPFKLVDSLKKETAEVTDTGKPDQSAERLRQLAENHKRKVADALAHLQVHGVILGSTPVARISDGIYRVGDTIDDMFTVKAIEGRGVQLEANGETYTLTLDDQNANSNSPRKR